MQFSKFYRKTILLKKKERGFTFIELLVVMIVVSTLAAFALPSLLGNIGKSRETEATINLGTLSRSQQSYHLENREFANTLSKLSDNLALNSKYYNFPNPTSASNTLVQHQAIALNVGINQTRNYSSGVYFDPLTGNFSIVICQGKTINSSVNSPTTVNGSCSNGGKKIQ